MKKIILFSLMSLFCVEVFAQVRFFEGTWEEALAKAKQENKVLMVDFYTTWCGPCKLMTKTTFADTNLGDFVNQNFIAYKIDCEKGEGFQLAEKYEIEGYPTICFIDKSGKLIAQEVGFKKAEAFLEIVKRYK